MKVINTISLDNVSQSDVGRYTIQAKNDSGEAVEYFDLVIQSNI